MPQYENPGPIAFSATIEDIGRGTVVECPFDLKQTYGVGNLVPVKVTFDGRVVYRGSLTKMGGRAVVGLRKDVQAQLGKGAGEAVDVLVELDEQPRTVELDPEFAAALERAGVRERFDALAYTHRREYAQWIAQAKRPETRARRIEQAVERIAAA